MTEIQCTGVTLTRDGRSEEEMGQRESPQRDALSAAFGGRGEITKSLSAGKRRSATNTQQIHPIRCGLEEKNRHVLDDTEIYFKTFQNFVNAFRKNLLYRAGFV